MTERFPTGEEIRAIEERYEQAYVALERAKDEEDPHHFERAFRQYAALVLAMVFADDLVDYEHQYHIDPVFHARVHMAAERLVLGLNPAKARGLSERNRRNYEEFIALQPCGRFHRASEPCPSLGTVEGDGT